MQNALPIREKRQQTEIRQIYFTFHMSVRGPFLLFLLTDIFDDKDTKALRETMGKTLPFTLGDPTSRLVAVTIRKDGRVMTQPTTGAALSPRGLHAACRIGN
jgi:hypothetical protein